MTGNHFFQEAGLPVNFSLFIRKIVFPKKSPLHKLTKQNKTSKNNKRKILTAHWGVLRSAVPRQFLNKGCEIFKADEIMMNGRHYSKAIRLID